MRNWLMRWPWTRDPDPVADRERLAEAERAKRFRRQAEQLTDRLARAADQLEQALNQQQSTTMRPGER